jgi:hypothetical protein
MFSSFYVFIITKFNPGYFFFSFFCSLAHNDSTMCARNAHTVELIKRCQRAAHRAVLWLRLFFSFFSNTNFQNTNKIMISEISKPKWHNEYVLSFLDDSFVKGKEKAFVQLDIAPYFEDKEDEFIGLSFSDNLMDSKGDYLPLEFYKEDLIKLIDFLQLQLCRFSSTEP